MQSMDGDADMTADVPRVEIDSGPWLYRGQGADVDVKDRDSRILFDGTQTCLSKPTRNDSLTIDRR